MIISPPYLHKSAERLALLHQEHDGMQTLIVSPEEIYNEFSSGSQDVTAIRDFMRMLYKKDVFKNGPGYLLLFGDGSFDYKDRVQENTNIVPTYESQESLRETQSYVTDDYFGLLDDDEGAYCAGVLDIGIGRFPVINEEEANSVIDKIENYIYKDQYNLHDWAETICFIADDGDNNLHFKQADKQLASIVDTLHPGLNINKIYSDAYPKIKVPGGYRFPEVNTKITSQVENGALILNYTGHGGLIGWSEEMILDVPMINNFANFNNLPL
ncbi:MAG: C25 family cysteine peptidase, partial [Flavobacteriaceae bacterium]|nr:C25 family cysteine peptidase [Flavobacteriaceae bacterium]